MLRPSRPPPFRYVYRRFMSGSPRVLDKPKTGSKSTVVGSMRGVFFANELLASDTPTARSSCAADTVLTGVNYLRGQPPVVAQADEEYPTWLWSVLRPKEYEDDGPGGRKERAERRKANRQAIKDRNFMQTQ
jgi:large subunit ribosomal protein L54